MAANALTLDAARADGFPVYSLTMEVKWHEMQLLLRYDRTRLIEDGIVGQTMHGQALCWHFHPHAWSVPCGGKLSPLDTFADDERLRRALQRRERYGSLKSQIDLRKAVKTVSGSQSVSNFRATAAVVVVQNGIVYLAEAHLNPPEQLVRARVAQNECLDERVISVGLRDTTASHGAVRVSLFLSHLSFLPLVSSATYICGF